MQTQKKGGSEGNWCSCLVLLYTQLSSVLSQEKKEEDFTHFHIQHKTLGEIYYKESFWIAHWRIFGGPKLF